MIEYKLITKVSHPLKHCLFSFTFAYRPPYSLTFNITHSSFNIQKFG